MTIATAQVMGTVASGASSGWTSSARNRFFAAKCRIFTM